MSDSVRPRRRQPTRLPCPWDSPGKNTGVGCHFLPQCMKVKSESEVAHMNKVNGCDGIPVELFQILKDDAVKLLHYLCYKIWKSQQWPQDWKKSVFIPIPKKGNAKECSNFCTIALISHASMVILIILQASLP